MDKFNPRLIPNQNNDADIWTPADWNDLFISFFPLHLSFLSPSLFLLPSFIFLCLFIYISLYLSLTTQFSFSLSPCLLNLSFFFISLLLYFTFSSFLFPLVSISTSVRYLCRIICASSQSHLRSPSLKSASVIYQNENANQTLNRSENKEIFLFAVVIKHWV